MTEIFIISIITVTNFVVTIAALIFSVKSLIEIEAMKRSTHSIQYVPADELLKEPGAIDEQTKKKLSEDPWEAL